MSTELFTLTLAFRGLSDDPEANDENTDLGEEQQQQFGADGEELEDDDDNKDDKNGAEEEQTME